MKLSYATCRLTWLALVYSSSAVAASDAATGTWTYDASAGQTPDAIATLGLRSSTTGSAVMTGSPAVLNTSDTSSTEDGRYYYMPAEDERFARADRVRVEVTVQVTRSTGSPVATCFQIPLPSPPDAPRKIGTLTLGVHGEGHQQLVGDEDRLLALAFVTAETDRAADEARLLDLSDPARPRTIGRHRLALNVPHTFIIEINRSDRLSQGRIRFTVAGVDQPPVECSTADLGRVVSAPYGFLFGHPAGSGVADAAWHRITVTFENVRPATQPVAVNRLPLPVDIQRHRQLFLDDALIESAVNVQRRLARPVKHPANPVFKREKPWEASRCELYGSCVWDPDDRKLKLFYTAMDVPYNGRMAYAESSDGGATWHRPELDICPFNGQKTNIVWTGVYYVAGPSVIRDAADPDPARRYKLFTADLWFADPKRDKGPQGMYVAFSPDGIHWTGVPNNPVYPSFNSDTAQSVIRHPATGRYLAYIRLRASNRRSVGIMTSDDFIRWTEPRLIYAPLPEDRRQSWEYYGMSVTPYEGIFVGLLWVFPAVPASADWKTDTPVTWLELVVSRDGESWQRVAYGQQFPPLGPVGSFDHRQIRPASSLVVLDDRILLLYSATPDPHVAAHKYDIGLATLRKDGFAAMAAGAQEGTLTTCPLRFDAGRLLINACTDADGVVKVELLDRNGKVVNGYDIRDARPFTGDSINASIAWRHQNLLPAGEGHRLRFILKNAELYSFSVQPATLGTQPSGKSG